MSTRAQILAEIAAQFPDNTTGLITPAKLRQVVEDVTNSCLVSETDAGTAGIAVLQAETPTAGRAALNAQQYDPTATVITHTGGATASQGTGSYGSSVSGARVVLVVNNTAGSTIAATNANELIPPGGGSENIRNLDALSATTFTFSVSAVFDGLIWRSGYGKVSTDAVGNWNKAGYGFALRNNALKGWVYGDAALAEVDLATTVAPNVSILLTVERTSTDVRWYVNGVRAATHTVSGIGMATSLSTWRHELLNGAAAATCRAAASATNERLISGSTLDVGPGIGTDLLGLTALEVGGYKTQSVAGAVPFLSQQPSNAGQSRLYFVPKGDQSAVTDTNVIAGIKLFGSDFIVDQANYDDFGIYNCPHGLVLNSKRLGTGAVKSFFFCDQDTDFFAKFDVVTREIELLMAGKGIVMKSPDGTRYRITVANGGALSATAV